MNLSINQSGSSQNCCTVYVGGLATIATPASIRKYFSKCGKVKKVRMAYNPRGEKAGFAYVDFADSRGVETALKIRYPSIEGREIKISLVTG
ncbi:unnamed protein product [Blepharisma stoltei]|uniref:RRM domain-containing protein n=1 Tax=Blepharisma stoltei TaxID=1481888 RepID=A0AAU9ITY8_9CILI|nr:unnamed protein product [Blepharisma stoltei]